jgi:SM-20-related protein
MHALDLAAFKATPLQREPFPYLIVPGFVKADALTAVHRDYPRIDSPGSFPVGQLTYGPAFHALLEALEGREMRTAFADKFAIALAGRPTMVTVRGRSGTKDGNIHTDAVTKLITVLIYMNPQWEDTGGRLRLLRSAHDIEDVLVEVPPLEGTLLAFQRSDNSYHGHKPFIGPRRVIQLNWVTDNLTVRREVLRHRFSAWIKRMAGLFRRSVPHDAAINHGSQQ